MRLVSAIPALSTLLALLPLFPVTIATPSSPDEDTLDIEGNALEKRCVNPCGYNDWLCCKPSQTCSVNSANEAVCLDGPASVSEWQYYTTTYVVTSTDRSTITSVWSSQFAAATAWPGTCRADLGEVKCGATCCEAGEECQDGECVAESSSAALESTAEATATPGVRETSSGMATVTQTSSEPTITQGFIAPVGTNGTTLIGVKASSGGLSGGAIAGIVIGSIAGVIFLLLLCGCLCCQGALYALLAALGLRKRRRRESGVEERYSHHSHGSRPRPSGGRTWFGTKPGAGTASEVSEKKESKWGGWATVAIILGALALCLGLKRRGDREEEDDKSTSYTYPSSYYYYSDYTRSKFKRSSSHVDPGRAMLTSSQAMTVPTDEPETHDDHEDRGVDANEPHRAD